MPAPKSRRSPNLVLIFFKETNIDHCNVSSKVTVALLPMDDDNCSQLSVEQALSFGIRALAHEKIVTVRTPMVARISKNLPERAKLNRDAHFAEPDHFPQYFHKNC